MAIERDTRRYACIHDLNNYFKKKDLLGGLTELEQEQLRKNIGIIDYGGEGGQRLLLQHRFHRLCPLLRRGLGV